MIFSACLAILSIRMTVQTVTSISELYKRAQPPHFAQMHKGDMNQDEINQFMSENQQVTYNQIVTMINVYGEDITVVGSKDSFDLSESRLDIGIVKQNESKDCPHECNTRLQKQSSY